MKTVLHQDPQFDAFVRVVQHQLASFGTQPLFTTDVDPDLFFQQAYLGGFASHLRQYHNCNCCRRFIQRYGTLATIDDNGVIRSAMWPQKAEGLYAISIVQMGAAVEASKITGVFCVGTDEHQLGQDIEGGHRHLHVPTINMRREREPGPWMALKIQDFDTLSRALVEYPVEIVAQAVALLEGDDMARSEKERGPARFLLDLHKATAAVPSSNMIWRALAHAPVGWATPRSGMIGTLLDDLVAGLALPDVKAKFAAKMHPLAYQRPTAAPKAGAVAAAEKLVADLNLAPALDRRMATIDDLELLWRRPFHTDALKPIKAGVFAGLLAEPTPIRTSAQITWSRFQREVLPQARKIEFQSSGLLNMCGILTETNPGSKRLFQWDNPVSHYTYHTPYGDGMPASRWNVPGSGWVDVEGVTLAPYMWEGNHLANHAPMALLLVKGSYDTEASELCLFPEFLRSELHGVRAVIEAHSKRGRVKRVAGAIAGLTVNKGRLPHLVRVTTDRVVNVYTITGW